jgi:hypothetical protein
MSGTTIDYAYSRHLVDPGKSTVYGLAIEFGLTGVAQPPVEEMERIVTDISSGMLALCLHARRPSSTSGSTSRPTSDRTSAS